MRIIHLSDLHCRLKERHEEYKEVFDRLYVELKNQNPDRILLTGDIVHSKITLSPELVSLVVDFLQNLSKISPLDIIVGNHDMNMSNMDRMDALTPIINAARGVGSGNVINYYSQTGLYEFSPGFVYGVYSLLDGGDIHLTKKEDGKVYIALYHGLVAGCTLDNDYVMSDSSTPLSTFDNFDFGMFGDIHKRQFLNESKTIAYAGSAIQQNFSEEIEKGFLVWDIRTPTDFDCEFVRVYNDYAFATIYADGGKLPDLVLPLKTNIRVIWETKAQDISKLEASRLNSLIRSKYNPLSIQLTFKPTDYMATGTKIKDESNLSDPDVQRDLLKQWLENLDDEVNIDEILEIDRSVTDIIVTNEFEDFSNSNWHLKKMSMENFMSYDKEVEIDFDKMRGVVGLFGDNAVGKSVIIDAILYGLFNKTTREIKNEELVNKYTGRDSCTVKLQLEIAGVDYEITRWTTRQFQKGSGRFLNARTDVTLKRKYEKDDVWENLTETQRNETEKTIRNAIGSFDDFMITTLSTQGGSAEFLKFKRSPRADIILRFLGLDVFNNKYEYTKSILKQIEHERKGYDKGVEIELLDVKKRELSKVQSELKSVKKCIDGFNIQITNIRDDISKYTGMINTTIRIDKDVDTINSEISSINDSIKSLDEQLVVKTKLMEDLVDVISKLEKEFLLDESKVIELSTIKSNADKIKAKIKSNLTEISTNKRILKIYNDDLEKENKCPVFDDIRHESCAFLSGYISRRKECEELIGVVESLQAENYDLEDQVSKMEYVYSTLNQQELIRENVTKAIVKLSDFKRDIVDIQNKQEVKSVSLRLANGQLKMIGANEETIKKNREYKKRIGELNLFLQSWISDCTKKNDEREELGKKILLIEREISSIIETIDKIKSGDDKHKMMSVYCSAMHRTGLPVDILRKYIPKINYEINNILNGVVNFGTYLKIDGGETDIDIVMKYHGEIDDTRPAIMGSGMEKMLMNIAIRYALLSVSNLNISSSWIQDEGFGVLSVENRLLMKQLFDNVRNTFRNIIIITHLDELKDIADHIVYVEKKDGISKLNFQTR